MKKISQRKICDPIHYAYKGRYIKGRLLGNILAGLIVITSLVMGYFTRSVIFDTVICAFTVGNFLRNIGILILLKKMGNPEYYNYDKFAMCSASIKEKRVGIYDEMIRRGHRITLSFGFFELYFPFLLTLMIPGEIGKIVVPLVFVLGVTTIKILCNPIKTDNYKTVCRIDLRCNPTYIRGLQPKRKSSLLAKLCHRDIFFSGFDISGENYYRMLIVFRAILTNTPFYVVGLMLSCQTRIPVRVFDDLRVVIPILLVGVLSNLWNDCKVYDAYLRGKKNLPFDFVNQMVANYFGIKTWDDVYEERVKEEKERKRKEAEKERLSEERRKRIIYARLEAENRRIREWEEKERKRKEEERKREEEERFKKVQRKFEEGKISEISEEDYNKLMKLEAEKFKVKIRESSRTSRATVNRKIE